LAESNATQAYEAICRLLSDQNQATRVLKNRIRAVPRAKPSEIADLLTRLDNDNFATREEASKELAYLGTQAKPALTRALAEATSIEARMRIKKLLNSLQNWVIKDPETLRALRAIWVLERTASADAYSMLEDLAKGAPGARPTQEAQAALDLLKRN
jgi:hypothetical protein